MKIALKDKDTEIEPVPTDAHGHKTEPELDRLSNILKTFNEHFGTLFTDTDRVAKRIRDDIAPKVAADAASQNAKENTPHTSRMAHDQALAKVMRQQGRVLYSHIWTTAEQMRLGCMTNRETITAS